MWMGGPGSTSDAITGSLFAIQVDITACREALSTASAVPVCPFVAYDPATLNCTMTTVPGANDSVVSQPNLIALQLVTTTVSTNTFTYHFTAGAIALTSVLIVGLLVLWAVTDYVGQQ
jgi:hypothetical protein